MARRMKYDVETKEEAKDGEDGFLSRWSARKSKIAKGEDVPDEVQATEIAEDALIEDEEDAALTDAELLKKYDLPDIEAVTKESGLEQFLNGKGLPGRVRQMALRRLWRLNPLFGVVDDMVEYGEDYTDAATVIEGMKTAYTVGKGYAKAVIEPEESESEDGAEAEDQDEDQAEDQDEDQAEDRADKTPVDQTDKSKSDDELTDGADETAESPESADNAPGGAQDQRVVSAEEKPEGHGAEAAEISYGLPKIAQTAPDLIAAVPTRRPYRMSFAKPKNDA